MTDLVAQASAELYAADPEEFTARRQRLVAAARACGDREAAQRIGALRKPTKAAWLLNRLVRAQPEISAQLAVVADGLREAERARDGARLRELSGARSALVDEFTTRALAAVPDPPSVLREDIAATLGSAIADPAVASDLAAGTLIRAAHWAGFGSGAAPFPAAAPDAASAADAAAGAAADAASAAGAAADAAAAPVPVPPLPADRGRQRPHSPPRPPTHHPSPLQPAQEPAVETLRITAERNRRTQQLQDAQRAMANAATVAAAAEENETRLEDLVRDLEQRLVVARAELSEARLRSRRAEAAERKARQALDRLSPDPDPDPESR